jgi:predicted nucleic acid-binding protein
VEPVFVDAVAWIALLNTRDQLHEAARRSFEELRRVRANLVTTEFVLLEVADALSAPSLRRRAVAFINGLRTMRRLRIVAAHPDLLADGWSLFEQRVDKDWSLTDCISFTIMTREEVAVAFTSDQHFVQAGFSKLL